MPCKNRRMDEIARRETIEGFPRYLRNPNPNKGSENLYRLWAVMHSVRIHSGIEAKFMRATKSELANRQMIDYRPRSRPGGPLPKINVNFSCQIYPRPCESAMPRLLLQRSRAFRRCGRRLGYPVKLVLTVQHIFNRWVSPTEEFNMDGSMKHIGGDQYHDYIDRWRPWRSWERTSTVFHRPITPREELCGIYL